MSISSIATKVTYSGNNSTVTPYTIPFKYLEDSHVNVYIDGVLQVEGAGQNYVLAGDGTAGTGTFTTTVAQAGTKSVVAVLDVELDQPVSLQETGSLPAKTLEQAYDRLNMQIRRVWRKAQDALTFSSDEGGTGSTGTADNLLGFDGSGDLAEIPNTTFEPAKGVDDNFVTDAEKVVIGNTSGTNTGDQVIPVSGVDFDPAGTDNSTDVTKAGTGTYVSLAGQVLTVDEIDEADLNASINASLDKADTSIQSLASIEGNSLLSTGATVGQVLQSDGDTTCSFVDLIGGGNAQTANPLSQFAQTTSLELKDTISDETGSGALVFATSPALVTPALGTPSAVDLTNATNTPLPAAGTVTETMLNTSANLSLDKADTSLQVANNLSDVTASTARTNLGLGTLATQSGTFSGTSSGTNTGDEVTATATTEGVVELATQAEVDAGTDTSRVITPETLAAYSGLGGVDPSVTGTASFTNSTNNISLTGVGDLGGTTEVGDVIQVSGSTGNNKLYTVSTRTDANNIIVNEEFAGLTASALEANKALATENTGSQTITLYCKARYAPTGLGQGYISYTTGTTGFERDQGTVYTNTTGRPLLWTCSVAINNTNVDSEMRIDGVVAAIFNPRISDTTLSTNSLIVPDGSTYESDLGEEPFLWTELR